MTRIHAYLAQSLDGFIAGPADELDWLTSDGAEDTFTPFFATIGAMLMGRRTYDVVAAMEDVTWPYGDTPVLVATTRPLDDPLAPTIRPVGGDIATLVDEARRTAGDRDVWIDGGALIRSAIDAGLVDDLTLTVIPIALGAGRPLLAGLTRRQPLQHISCRPLGGGLVELRYRIS